MRYAIETLTHVCTCNPSFEKTNGNDIRGSKPVHLRSTFIEAGYMQGYKDEAWYVGWMPFTVEEHITIGSDNDQEPDPCRGGKSVVTADPTQASNLPMLAWKNDEKMTPPRCFGAVVLAT